MCGKRRGKKICSKLYRARWFWERARDFREKGTVISGKGELGGDTEAGLHIRRLLRLRGDGVAVHGLVKGAPGIGVARSLSHHPPRVVGQVRLPDMPTGLYEHCLEGVHADAIVCAVARWVHIVVAAPVALISPVQVCRVPASLHQEEIEFHPNFVPRTHLGHLFFPCLLVVLA